ncbi:DUF4334 domain-containing protein [Gordonia rhizosphera]|uniref:GXWXG domain-containing protein n=1 Tax=Gordonia rhizosphera NBRC 16068 TaxID=1108045 RepID=K6VT17_9ACTN|nr:DUF4334 domain-containing protein [Gordonia rhizosphera]GAB90055.1 hypothetical protein GORHZ_082_00050 [Gordonia rhizosphera NBRC 16068]
MTSAPALTRTEAQERFRQLRAATGLVDDAELDAVWAALETIRPEQLFGAWKGDEFLTGHPVNGMLEKARWFGKTFTSRSDVQPLMCLDEDGSLYSNKKLGKGEASLWLVEFRGEVTASMVYDGQAVIDHFKKVDDNTVMGIMNGKDAVIDGRHLYFLLERV